MSNNLKFIGGLSDTTLWLDNGKHLSRNYRQGNRIYDSCGIATGLTSQGVGSYGGHSGLYLVNQNEKGSVCLSTDRNKSMNKVKLTMNELFSGIGAQKRGIDNTGLFDCEVICTSDIDKDAMLSYAAIHCGLTLELIENYEYPSAEEMAEYLDSRNIGYDFENGKAYDWHKKLKSKDLKKYYLACILSKNMGDISKIKELPYADLWTTSWPCTDISVAGEMKGMTEGSGTRSSLLWQQIRLLRLAHKKGNEPKFIFFENVKNLVSKKYKPDFDKLLSILDELGYNTYWQVLSWAF